jgi:16S rRNA processing protein RimM
MQPYLPACKIVTTHGVRGELKVLPLCDDVPFLSGFATLYGSAQGTQPVRVLSVRGQGNAALLRLAGVEDMDAARAWVGRTLYLARADVRLPQGRLLVDDLLGCAAKDAATGEVYGTVTAVTHPGAQDIYTVTDAQGGEHLIPAVAEFVRGVDTENRVVLLAPIEGMFSQPLNGDEE